MNESRYELRLAVPSSGTWELEVYQLPATATPRLAAPEYVAGLKGVSLRLLEQRLLKKLARQKVHLGTLKAGNQRTWTLPEETALELGLLFRVLAPMRNLDRITQVADGIETFSREELGYWLGMVMHRPNPRRVLAALRLLLTSV